MNTAPRHLIYALTRSDRNINSKFVFFSSFKRYKNARSKGPLLGTVTLIGTPNHSLMLPLPSYFLAAQNVRKRRSRGWGIAIEYCALHGSVRRI